jgi:hypothetical protein
MKQQVQYIRHRRIYISLKKKWVKDSQIKS